MFVSFLGLINVDFLQIIPLVVMSFLIGSLWWKIGDSQPDVDSPDMNGITSWVMNLAGLMFFYGVSIFMNIMITLVITCKKYSLKMHKEYLDELSLSSSFFPSL